MERNREPRRGIMAAVNGGLSRRRQRNSCLRDSPEEDDGGMEVHEAKRLRDRGSKKDRSSRRKRRMLHRDGDDSSEESFYEEEDDDEEDTAVAVRLLPPPPPHPPPSPPHPSNPAPLQQNHHHRKSFPPKITRLPPWKAADEIGVPIPKKARSASTKRSHECWVPCGGGGEEQIQRQQSTSPSRLSPASTAQIVQRKMKTISGSKQRPPKMLKSSSSTQEEIEIEVAEVLYKMTRQILPPKQESNRMDLKDANESSNEAKSRVPSPNSVSPPPTSQTSNVPLPAFAPKMKRPRPVKSEDEMDFTEGCRWIEQPMQSGVTSPKSENGVGSTTGFGASIVIAVPPNVQKEFGKLESNQAPEFKASDVRDWMEINGDIVASPKKPTHSTDLVVNLDESTRSKGAPAASAQVSDSHREDKHRIDLMALPPGKPSPNRDSLFHFATDHTSVGLEIELVSKLDDGKRREESKKMATQKAGETSLEDKKAEKVFREEFDSKKPMAMEKTLDPKHDLVKQQSRASRMETTAEKQFDGHSGSKHQNQKHESRASRMESIPEKNVQSTPLPMPMVAGWTGSFPPFGYMGQVPSLQAVPMDGAAGSSTTLQLPNFLSPPVRPKRCATHCYIAQNIYFHERIARMNSFWPAAAGTAAMFGAKPMNLNVVPPLESAFLLNPESENISTGNTKFMEGVQRKQLLIQQSMPQPGSAGNMLGPAFLFPLNQQQAAVAAAAATAFRSAAVKSTAGVGNAAPSSNSAGALNFGYAPLTPNDAQYLAILQNSAYPFPIPAHVGGPLPYRGAAPPQAMPFFNGSLYSPQMLHLQQQQQQQQPTADSPQQPPHGHQNTSTSSGSSSSQKHLQKRQRVHGGASPRSFPSMKQQLQLESETGCGDSPSSAGSRISQAQKSIFSHNLPIPIRPPNIALMPPAAAQLGQHEKQQSDNRQVFPMPFSSFNAGNAPPGLNISSMAQNYALFQSFPEAARHGYQNATESAVQPKQPREDGQYAGDSSMNASISLAVTGKTRGTSVIIDSPCRESNLVPSSANGSRASDRSSSTSAAAPMASAIAPHSHQIQQRQLQLQHQHQRTKSSDSTKFPQTLPGFPQGGLVQCGSSSQSPQWNAAGRTATPAPSPSPDSVAMRNHLLEQQRRATQQTTTPFGTNPLNAAPSSALASPLTSASKSNGGNRKLGPPATKSSTRKSSPNRNPPSNLGQPHAAPATTNSTTAQHLAQLHPQYYRLQKQQQQFLQKHPQMFFSSNPYMQSQQQAQQQQFYQRCQSEQQAQQQNSYPVSTGMLAHCSAALPLSGSTTTTSDPAAKVVGSAAAANSMKGLPPAGLMHAAQLAATAQYISMPPLSVKPVADQTVTNGNDNLNAWRPEKR